MKASILKSDNPNYEWMVAWPRGDGKRRGRKYFRSDEKKGRQKKGLTGLEKAEAFAQKKTEEIADLGRDVGALTEAQKREAARAYKALAQMGQDSLWPAVELYLNGKSESILLSEAVTTYAAEIKNTGCSARHIDTLEGITAKFSEAFPGRYIGEFKTPEISKYLERFTNATTRNNHRRYLSGLFNWAYSNDLATENPVSKTRHSKSAKTAPGILAPADMCEILLRCPDHLRPLFLLGGFAGMRSSEIYGSKLDENGEGTPPLTWGQVELDAGEIVLARSKTVARRIPIEDNLAEWLAPIVGEPDADVIPGNYTTIAKRYSDFRKRLKVATGIDIPNNALRHSYGSYMSAILEDFGKVAFRMGNSPAVVRSNYLNWRNVAQAEEWFCIYPG